MKYDLHDPLTAIAEDDASGATAELFADIRRTMNLPLITSIWRILAGIDGALALEKVWSAVRPLYDSGQIEASWQRLQHDLKLPNEPAAIHVDLLVEAGLNKDDLLLALSLVRAYNRSNGLNLLALTTLLQPPLAEQISYPEVDPPGTWPAMPQLHPMNQLSKEAQNAVLSINELGCTDDNAVVATLWRHLGSCWPDLLPLALPTLAPICMAEHLQNTVARTLHMATAEGSRLAAFLPRLSNFSPEVRAIVNDYVQDPQLVLRMVVIGIALQRALESSSAVSGLQTRTP